MAERIVPPKTYLLVYVALLVLTVTTVGISRLPLNEDWHLVIGLCIGAVKATLVILVFMHVMYSSRLTWLVALSGLFFLAILLFLTMNDYLSRGWYPRSNF